MQPGAFQGIRCHDARSASIGHNGDILAFQKRLKGKSDRVIEKLFNGIGAQYAGLFKCSVIGFFRAGERAGVRGDGARSGRRLARLDGDDWRFLGHSPRHFHKALAVGETLHVADDDARFLVVFPGFEQINLIDVRLVAQADKAGETDIFGQRPVQDRGTKRARLGHEGDGAFLGHADGERGVQRRESIYDTQAVGADDADAVFLGNIQNIMLQLGALAPRFAKSGSNDNRALDALLPALAHDVGHKGAGHDDDRQINRAGRLQNAGQAFHPQDFLTLGIDRVNLTLEAVLNDILENAIPQLGFVAGSAHDGYRLRVKEHIEHNASPVKPCGIWCRAKPSYSTTILHSCKMRT